MKGFVEDTTFEEEMHKLISSFVLLFDFFNVCLIDNLVQNTQNIILKTFPSFFLLVISPTLTFYSNQILFIKHGESRQQI